MQDKEARKDIIVNNVNSSKRNDYKVSGCYVECVEEEGGESQLKREA